MEQKSKVGMLSVLIALIALLFLISSIAIVEFSQSKKASVENLINPFEVYDDGSGFSGSNIQVFNSVTSDDSDTSDDEDDTEAPGTITGLTAGDIGSDYIYWTWTNPTDSDFYRSRVYLNGVYQTSTSNNFYNATGLDSNTSYTIMIHTMDDSANVNTTDVSDTQTTLPGSSSPNSPVITPIIPNRNFNEDTSNNAIILNNYVTDPDTLKANLVWSVSGNTNVIVSINPLDNNRVTFSATANWNGVETITLRVQDPEGNWDSQAVVVTVAPVEDPTVWNVLSDQTINEDSAVGTIAYPGVVLQVSDPDSPTIVSVTSTNTHFNVGIVGTNLVLNSLEHNWYGSELVTLTCNGLTASFTLNVNHLMDDCSTEYSLGGVEYTLCD